jgi:hypothetical protein
MSRKYTMFFFLKNGTLQREGGHKNVILEITIENVVVVLPLPSPLQAYCR